MQGALTCTALRKMAHASTAGAKAVDESYVSTVSGRLYRARRLAARVLIARGGGATIDAGNPP
jgi:hypothetical protein